MLFYHYNPVKIIHGDDVFPRVWMEIPDHLKVAIVHGRSLIKHQFAIEEIKASGRAVSMYELPEGEPTCEMVDDALSEIGGGVDYIVGIGGGRVMDATKAIAVCMGNQMSVDVLRELQQEKWQKTTPFALVSTRPGSGSEMNNAFVLKDRTSGEKKSYYSLYSYPRCSVQDGRFYAGLDTHEYALALADAMSHVLDQYLVDRDPMLISDSLAVEFLRMGGKLSRCSHPSEREFLMLAWLSGLVSSGLISRGVRTSWGIHAVAHKMSERSNLRHPETIALSVRSALKTMNVPTQRLTVATAALQGDSPSCTDEDGLIDELVKFFSRLGLKT